MKYLKDKYIHLHIMLLVVSILICLIRFIPYGYDIWNDILLGVGCGFISSTIISFLLYIYQLKRNDEKLKVYLEYIYKDIYMDIKIILQSFIWLYDHIENDKLNWTKEPSTYFEFEFICESYICFGEDKKIDFVELNENIEELSKKIDLKELNSADELYRKKICNIFRILNYQYEMLFNSIEDMEKNKIVSLVEFSLNQESIDIQLKKLRIACHIASRTDKNFKIALSGPLQIFKEIRNYVVKNDNFKIEIGGKIPIEKL